MTPPLGDRKSRRTTHALLAAALVAATVFLRVPTDLYHSSARDFASASRDILLTIFAAGALLFAVLALLFLALPARLKGPAAALLIVLASYAWVRSAFFPGPSLNLDGTRLTADLSTGVAGALLPPLTAMLLAWLAVRQPRGVTTFLALVLAGSLVQSIAATAAAWRVRPPTAPAAAAAALQWSRRGNVLILILDSLQSDVFEDALAEQPRLREQLDGFRYYRFASSSSPTTFLSLPTIHSGRSYDPNESARAFFEQAVRDESVLSRLAAAGYSASYAWSVGACPTATRCVPLLDLVHSRGEAVLDDVVQLLDLGVYRALPDGLRRVVLEQRGLLALLVRRDQIDLVLDQVAALERLVSDSTVSDSPPTAKIIHSKVTHFPLVLQADCSLGARRRYDPEGARIQALCAFKHVVALFERLRAEQAYDVSNIVVMADHGYIQLASRFVASGDARFRKIVGRFNPVLLVKPAQARGPLVTLDAPIELADVPKALCSATACDPAEGLQRLAMVDAERPRSAFQYAFQRGYWSLPQIPGLVRYTIRGDLRRPESWMREATAYAAGTVVDLRRGQNAEQYLGFGWGQREATHTWMVDTYASVRLRLPFAATHEQRLVLETASSGPGEPATRRVSVEVNGVAVGELSCAGAVRHFASHRLRIPRHALARSQDVTIGFRLRSSGGDSGENVPPEPCLALQTLELRPAS
jgi:hypothetical protein